MSHRMIARMGLAAAVVNFVLAMGFLGYQTFSRTTRAAEVGRPATPALTLSDARGRTVSVND